MLFVTVGTMRFDRLAQAMDDYARAHDEPVQIQVGDSPLTYAAAETVAYVSDLPAAVSAARVVVCHAGIGTLSTLLDSETPFVLFPRRAAMGEHFDDHQWEFVQRVSPTLPCTVAYEAGDLEQAIAQAPGRRRSFRHESTRPQLTQALSQMIQTLCRGRAKP